MPFYLALIILLSNEFYIKIVDILLLRIIFRGIGAYTPQIIVNRAIWCALDAGVHFLKTFS